ncbi:DinB family protein [Catellatospora sp. NPDC049609]|uniref:DinB family protein n=1 Tax=Catellatospora sp. NPDC049609 TaxID=3155505 RepID=UPI00342340E1
MTFQLPDAVAALSRTPDVLDALLGDLGDGWARHRPAEGEWSAHEVVAHFIHGERTDWIPRARIILEHGPERPFTPFEHGHEAIAEGRTTAELLDLFRTLRAENLAALRGFGLTDADLAREGTHPAFGPVTMGQLLATWTTHDHVHLGQITQALATRYTAAVGPWHAYLWE